MKTDTDELMKAWDKMDRAAQRMLTAQPYQMTEAAERLDVARREMSTAVQVLSALRNR